MPRRYKIYQLSAKAIASYAEEKGNGVYGYKLSAAATERCKTYTAKHAQYDNALFHPIMCVINGENFKIEDEVNLVTDLSDVICYIDFKNIFDRNSESELHKRRQEKCKFMFHPNGIELDFRKGSQCYATFEQSNSMGRLSKVTGEDITDTVLSATVQKSDLLAVELKTSLTETSAGATADVYNLYGQTMDTWFMIAAYDATNQLIGVSKADAKIVDDKEQFTVNYSELPSGTDRISTFFWDSAALIPYAEHKVNTYSDNAIKTVVIHPGADESKKRFTWYNTQSAYGAVLQYALKSEYEAAGNQFTDENSVEVQGTTEIPYANTTDISCKAEISGLQLGTEYVYRLGNKYRYDDTVYSFKTYNPEATGKQVFGLITDIHNQVIKDSEDGTYTVEIPKEDIDAKIALTQNTLQNMLDNYDVEFMLSTGDNVSQGNMGYASTRASSFRITKDQYRYYAEKEMDQMFAPVQYQSIPFASTLGNHDAASVVNGKDAYGSVTKYHYNLPNDDGYSGTHQDSGTHGNFWFRNGDVLIVGVTLTQYNQGAMIPTNAETNKAYIDAALAVNQDATWRILVNHVPGYSTTAGVGENIILRDNMAALELDGKFDLVYTGHRHTFSRSKQLLTDKYADSTYTTLTISDTDYVALNPKVSDKGVEEGTDANGRPYDVATDPEGAVHLTLPRLGGWAGGDELMFDHNVITSAFASSVNRNQLKHDHDGTAANYTGRYYKTNKLPVFAIVTVEDFEGYSQMKIETMEVNATAESKGDKPDVFDTYIIKKSK